MNLENQDLKTEASSNLKLSETIVVANQQDYEKAGAMLVGLKGLRKKIEETFNPIIEKAYQAHKEACSKRKEYTDPIDRAEMVIKNKVSGYLQEMRRKEEDERRAKEAILRKQQEEEAMKQAEVLNNAGMKDVAEEVLNTAIENAPVVEVAPIVQKVQGVSSKKVLKFRITDEAKVNRGFMVVDEAKIRNVVKAMGKEAEKVVGGIQVYEEEQVSVRG